MASEEKVEALIQQQEDPAFVKRTLWATLSPLYILCLIVSLWMDIRILPILALVYSFSFIDRINLGAAYAAGMATTLVRSKRL